jgi:hypothetical protein
MLHRTLVVFCATVALGCLPIATNAFADSHPSGHKHAAASRGGYGHGHRYARGYRHGYAGYGAYGYGVAPACYNSAFGCSYGPVDWIGNAIGGVFAFYVPGYYAPYSYYYPRR